MTRIPVDVPSFYDKETFVSFCKDLNLSNDVIDRLLKENDLRVINYALEKELLK